MTTGDTAPPLNPRLFGVFLALQAAVMAGLLLLTGPERELFFTAGAAVLGAAYLVATMLHPWLVIPMLVGTTSLDISGRLVQNTPIGIPLTGFHLALALLMVALAGNAALRRRLHFPPFEVKGPLVLLLGLIALSLTWSPNQPEATISFVRLVALTLFLYLTQVLIESKTAVTAVVVSLAACVAASSVLGLVQVLTEEFFLPASFVLAAGANTPRAVGTFHNPNHLGTFLMVGTLFVATVVMNLRMHWLGRLVGAGVIGVGAAGLVSTFSRANWVAGTLGLLVALGLSGKLRLRSMLVTLGVLTGGLLILQHFLPFAEYVVTRVISIFALFTEFESKANVSGSARVHFVLAGLGMWLDHPLLGAGWRAFPVILDLYKPEGFPHWIPTRESHTFLATLVGELGLMGLLAGAWLAWRILSRGLRELRLMEDPLLKAVLIALITVFVAFQISLSFTNDFTNNFLWFFTGIIFAVIHLDRRGRSCDGAARAAGEAP